MARLSEKSKIVTAKVGLSYETVYYYKQKVVNWEYTAPSSYDTLVFIESPEVLYHNAADMCLISKHPLSVTSEILITEDSIKNDYVKYATTFTNTNADIWTIDLLTYSYVEHITFGGYANTTLDTDNRETQKFDIEHGVGFDGRLNTRNTVTASLAAKSTYGYHKKETLRFSIPCVPVFIEHVPVTTGTTNKKLTFSGNAVFHQYKHVSITVLPAIAETVSVSKTTNGRRAQSSLAHIYNRTMILPETVMTDDMSIIFNADYGVRADYMLAFKSSTTVS